MRNSKLNKIKLHTIALGIAAGSYLFAPNAHAEEGMWTYDNAPKKQLKAKYNFDLSDKWLEHVRLSSVRFQDGGAHRLLSQDRTRRLRYDSGQQYRPESGKAQGF